MSMNSHQDPYKPPSGQPKPWPHTERRQGMDGNAYRALLYPHQIVKVRSKIQLKQALKDYGHPFPTAKEGPMFNNPTALVYLIEEVYPALRWFCKVYDVEVPNWLTPGETWADGLPESKMKEYFGKQDLRVVEFREQRRKAGKRSD